MQSQNEASVRANQVDVAEIAPDLRPNFVVVLGVTTAAALLSFAYVRWPSAAALTLLASLMITGAEVDARLFLLPDVVTYGATLAGILFAPVLDSSIWWQAIAAASLRAAGVALFFAALRQLFKSLRGHEGLGLGDVKLAAAVGAWLPLQAIPYCLNLATTAALLAALVRLWRGGALEEARVPFGAFLCPSLWVVFFLTALNR